jgi:type I restriction enzyme M protein
MFEAPEDKIMDYITGSFVRATPEETEAVQPFVRILVEDYGYPIEHMQAHPQWRVKVRPSDIKKEYPVDIAIFENSSHTDDTLKIIVECKKKNRKDGRRQLQDYMRLSKATIGVWFNGEERLYLQKIEHDGMVDFREIPNIPRFGERLEDLGKFRRQDLQPAENLKSTFKAIRNYLAANTVGITRDEVFASQMINLIFCKIYDERFTKPEDIIQFRAGLNEDPAEIEKRIRRLFEKVKLQYSDVIHEDDQITFDAKSLQYVAGELQLYSLQESSRDAVGAAFEVFIGPSLKGGQGQFFTPRNVVEMTINIVDPGPDDRILDPACGSGGFLIEALRYVWGKTEQLGRDLNWPRHEIDAEKQKVAIKNFYGIDKDDFLSKVAKAYLAILGDGRGGIHCENSLESPSAWATETQNDIKPESFDAILTNPPFGKKLSIDSEGILRTYELGHRWRKNSEDVYEKGKVCDKQPPQILFIERCLSLLKPGGKLGIVLLESIFGMPKYRYVVDFILKRAKILAIVTLPEEVFQPYTHAKCCVLVCQKYKKNESRDEAYDIFMCETKWCGHDSRGNKTIVYNDEGHEVLLDDIPLVASEYRATMGGHGA